MLKVEPNSRSYLRSDPTSLGRSDDVELREHEGVQDNAIGIADIDKVQTIKMGVLGLIELDRTHCHLDAHEAFYVANHQLKDDIDFCI